MIKNWMVGRPENKADQSMYTILFTTLSKCKLHSKVPTEEFRAAVAEKKKASIADSELYLG